MNRLGRSLLVVGVSMMVSACGRRGPLLYPDMLVPAAPSAVTAQQSGAVVKLQFALPDKDRAGRSVQGVAGVKISRKTAVTGQKDVCRSCTTDFLLLNAPLYLDHLPATTQRFGNRLVVLDSDVNVGNSYSYRIVPFTDDGVDGAPSPIADVRMGAVPLPPPALKIEALPTELKIKISVYPLIAARMLGYNLYRSAGTGSRSYLPLNREPLKGDEYVDSVLERGVKYRYSVKALIVRPSGDIAESAESDVVEGMLRDDE